MTMFANMKLPVEISSWKIDENSGPPRMTAIVVETNTASHMGEKSIAKN